MSTPVRWVFAFVLIAGGLWIGHRVWSGQTDDVRGALDVHTVTSSVAVADRRVTVWRPPGYDTLRADGYPVLYVQDGEQLFRSSEAPDWRIDEVLAPLIEEGSLPPVIVVGVHSTNQRLREYLPTTPFYLQPDSIWRPFRRDHGRPLGDEYMQHIYEDIIPLVHGQYHVTSDPSGMFIVGTDVGGLFALYAAAKMPFSFGGAAALGPDWTPGRTGADTTFVTAFRDYWAGQWDALRSARLYADYVPDSGARAFAPHRRLLQSFLRTRGLPQTQWRIRRADTNKQGKAARAERVEAAVRFLLEAPPNPSDQFFVPPALRRN